MSVNWLIINNQIFTQHAKSKQLMSAMLLKLQIQH